MSVATRERRRALAVAVAARVSVEYVEEDRSQEVAKLPAAVQEARRRSGLR